MHARADVSTYLENIHLNNSHGHVKKRLCIQTWKDKTNVVIGECGEGQMGVHGNIP